MGTAAHSDPDKSTTELQPGDFRRLVEESRDIFYMVNREGVLTYVSPQVRLYGLSPRQLTGKPFTDLLLPDDRDRARRDFEQSISRGHAVHTTFRIKDNRGRILHFEERGSVTTDQTGRVTGVLGVIRDITRQKRAETELRATHVHLERLVKERTAEWAAANTQLQHEIERHKATEEQLRTSEQRFREIAEHIREVFWVFDWDRQKVLYVNPAYKAVWGRQPDALLEDYEEWNRSLHPEDRAAARASFSRVARSGIGEIREYRIIRPDGSVRWISDRSAVIKDAGGNVRHIVGVAQDITDSHRTRKALQQHLETQRLVARFSTRFLHVTSVESALRPCLADLGRETGADAAFVILTRPAPGSGVATCVWQLEDGQRKTLQALIQELPASWREALTAGQAVSIAGPEGGSGQTGPLREGSTRLGMGRILLSPVLVAGELTGVLGMGRKSGAGTWDKKAHTLIKVLADLIGSTLVRKQAERELQESNDKFRNLFQESHDAIFVHELDGTILDVNDQATALFDYTKDAMLRMNVKDLHSQADKQQIRRALDDIRDCGAIRFGTTFRKADGTLFSGDVAARVFELSGRKAVQGIVRDVSARRHAEEALRASEARLKTVMESVPFDLFAIGSDGRYYLQNSTCREHWGNLIGKRPEDIEVDPETRKVWLDNNRRAFAGETVQEEVDYPVQGVMRTLYNVITPIRVGNSIESVLGLNVDITERKQAEQERAQLEERLRQAEKMQAIGQLAGGVAHDFNNILTAVQGNAELLGLDLPEGSQERRLVQQIVESSQRATELTKQLLAFARTGLSKTSPVDVHESIRNAINLLKPGTDRKIEIFTELKARASCVQGDAAQLQTAFLNLGLNARDAMPEGGRLTFTTRNVTLDEARAQAVSAELSANDYLEIRAKDTGAGMTEKVQRRIFEPFFTTKGQGKGTGLGLASVYGCVKSHGGAVRVISRPGKGSVFRILLPVVERKPQHEHQEKRPAARGAGHVLVVDDEEVVRDLAATALQNLGYRVSTSVDGQDAVETYKEQAGNIDLVILDMIMPRLDGAQTFEALRQIDPNVKVLIASGFSRDGTADQLLAAGAVGFLGKPFRIADLARVIADQMPGETADEKPS